MSVLKVANVCQLMEEIAPRFLAEEGDNVGLLIGEGSRRVERIMICLDLTEWTVDEAIEKRIDMVICHHPMIFKGIKRITSDDATGRKILKLIKHNISVYTAHTNLDSVSGGINDLIMERLGIRNSEILVPSSFCT